MEPTMLADKKYRPGARQFRFCIDRGGTFTDVYAEVPGEPGWRVEKLLSVDPHYEDAPREGIRRILEEVTRQEIKRKDKVPTKDIEWIRMGTTVATNALLEKQGEKTALCVTKGFGDLLEIGSQARPKIFDLTVRKPSPLYKNVIEVDERVQLALDSEGTSGEKAAAATVEGSSCGRPGEKDGVRVVQGISGEWVEVVRPLDVEALRPILQKALDAEFYSLAVVLMHSYTFPDHEKMIGKLAKEMGFTQVSLSSDLVPMVRIVPRGHTAVVDAYLTPKIQEYLKGFLAGFDDGLDQVTVSFMQSDGGLTLAQQFTGFKAILSGPAGGVVGYALTSEKETEEAVIGFDMGGTSTDVSRYHGNYEQVLETEIAGVHIQAPQLDINTVAAGGGSKLYFESGNFKVGPQSVGAHPGPVCYKKGGQLAVTDANLLLGRVLPDYFPKIFGPDENEPLDVNASRKAFAELAKEINAHRAANGAGAEPMSVEEVALGFLNVANEAMCRPIRQLTEMKGHDTSRHVLAVFGGAGPQHGCPMARSLKIPTVLVHRYAGILSAYGMGLADVISEAQEPVKLTYDDDSRAEIDERAARLQKRVKDDLRRQGFEEKAITTEVLLNLRYEGTDTSIMVRPPKGTTPADGPYDYAAGFVAQFKTEYGFELSGRAILVDDVRIHGTGTTNVLRQQEIGKKNASAKAEPKAASCYFETGWRHDTPVYLLSNLLHGHEFDGPVVIMNGNSTILVEPGSKASVTKFGNIRIDVGPIPAAQTPNPPQPPPQPHTGSGTTAHNDDETSNLSAAAAQTVSTVLNVVLLSIFNNRFMGIAEQMGRTLQRTSISTNIKERLDFSCALFSPDGGLVANAPHVPVHLGAMSTTVRWQINHWGDNLQDGDVLVTNHPAAGGSHLPDITVITPVFQDGKLVFFVASRGHHAEIGGITPGSMPPFSKAIHEEGAAIKTFKLVEKGKLQEDGIRHILTAKTKSEEVTEDGRPVEIPGTRKVEDNLSDLRAQVAANQRGITLIGDLIKQYGLDVVQAYMRYVQENAEQAVREMLRNVVKRVADEAFVERINDTRVVLRARDHMDDGSIIQLRLTIDGDSGEAEFDFDGTSPEVYGNWNAPEAVTAAAVIYCVRCLVDIDIPLNQGCLAPVTIKIPKGSFLSPSDKAAVVGGNVLTSQRITDVVLTAFQACACSQGCMNNLTFGDATFGYYETIGGGCGAGAKWDGTSGVQTHMTNTRITDPEIFERRYPILLHRFGLRAGSGGAGKRRGGDGIERDIEFRKPVTVSILSERRVHAPHGLLGGSDGARGSNTLLKQDGRRVFIGGKNTIRVQAGERLQILTPGGGGFGKAEKAS